MQIWEQTECIMRDSKKVSIHRAVFTWLSKGIGFGFGFGFTTPFGWLVYLLWFWFYDSQVKTALSVFVYNLSSSLMVYSWKLKWFEMCFRTLKVDHAQVPSQFVISRVALCIKILSHTICNKLTCRVFRYYFHYS